MSSKRKKIKESQLDGFKYFKSIGKLLEKLHDAGCQRDKAGNRKLHMDQYLSLILLYMFNPVCSSLRSIQQASELKKVQRKLNCPRASLGSLSEAARVFDSDLMLEIMANLADKLRPFSCNKKLDDVSEIITAVDGTLIKALPKMTWALYNSDYNAVKAHAHFDLEKYIPVKINITAGNKSEREVLSVNLEPGRIYVTDRGYAALWLFQKIIDNKSSLICRLRDSATYECLEELELSQDAIDAGIVFDKKVILGKQDKNRTDLLQSIRLIAVKCTPNPKRYKNGRGGPPQGETLLIATDRFDLDADVIALIFQHRWAVEIFFRFFKHVLGCRHLLSQCPNGIELQTYSAIIACMLISLWTEKKPTLRTYEMICWYFCGMADIDELELHISRLQNHD